jgi:molecular chaperone GrpE
MRKRKKNRDTLEELELEPDEPAADTELHEDEHGDEDDDAVQDRVAESDAELVEDDSVALVEVPEAAVERLSAELAEQKEQCLRLAAEFDNFRKRVERQRAEIRQNAQSEVVRSILETLDNLARVTALDAADANVEDVVAGVQMVERSLLRELEAAGLTKVGSVDERFDPNNHEAVSTAAAPDDEKMDLIAAVFQVGYRFGGILLRPARVQVYVAKSEDEDVGE